MSNNKLSVRGVSSILLLSLLTLRTGSASENREQLYLGFKPSLEISEQSDETGVPSESEEQVMPPITVTKNKEVTEVDGITGVNGLTEVVFRYGTEMYRYKILGGINARVLEDYPSGDNRNIIVSMGNGDHVKTSRDWAVYTNRDDVLHIILDEDRWNSPEHYGQHIRSNGDVFYGSYSFCNAGYYHCEQQERELKNYGQQGPGKYVYANGDEYEGYFKNGKRKGEGKLTVKESDDGHAKVYEGIWKDNFLVTNKDISYSDCDVDRHGLVSCSEKNKHSGKAKNIIDTLEPEEAETFLENLRENGYISEKDAKNLHGAISGRNGRR